MEAEVEWAIKQLKDNKAQGQDGIPIEMIKAGDGEMTKKIKKFVITYGQLENGQKIGKVQSLFLYLKRETRKNVKITEL